MIMILVEEIKPLKYLKNLQVNSALVSPISDLLQKQPFFPIKNIDFRH